MLHRFERPQSIAEAARLLASGSLAVLAGGTDLYPAHVGRRIDAPLLDITAIAGLRGIRGDDRGWTIGATTEATGRSDEAARRDAGTGACTGDAEAGCAMMIGSPLVVGAAASTATGVERGKNEIAAASCALGVPWPRQIRATASDTGACRAPVWNSP